LRANGLPVDLMIPDFTEAERRDDVAREHRHAAVDELIREFDLERIFGFAPGTKLQ
jgi:hypothetical protein